MSKLEQLIAALCPDGVEYQSLGGLGYFYGGLSGKEKDDFTDGNAKYISYMNVFSHIAVNTDINDKVKVGESEKQNIVQYGDVLFTGSSETPDECGMSSVLTQEVDENLYLNSFCFGFRMNDTNLLLPDFSKHLFRSEELRKQIKRTASGVTRFNVSKTKMKQVVIPLPPLPVQREIIRILDNFTELTAELTTELTARKKQHEYYRNMLLSFEDDAVQWMALRDVADFRNGKGHEQVIVSEGKYIVINSKFISTNGRVKKYSDMQISPLFRDDIVMVMSDLPNGRALAKCFLVGGDDIYTLNQRIGALRVKDNSIIDTKFLYYVLNRNKQLLRYDNGVDQTNLKKDQILNISIPVPPLAEQVSIVAILDRFDALCNDPTSGLPAEIEGRRKQYEYYRDKLLSFKEKTA